MQQGGPPPARQGTPHAPREHAGQAMDIYTGLGVVEAAEARDLLASLG